MRRRSLFTLGATTVLVVLAVGVLILFQDPDRYREEVASLLSEAAGQPVVLQGPLDLSWRPSPTLSVSSVRADTPSARVLLDSVQVRVEPAALLTGRLRAREVRVDGLVVDLITDAPDAPLTIPDPANIPVDHLMVSRVVVRRAGKTVFRIDRAELSDPESSRGAKVDLALPVPGGVLGGRVRMRVSGNRVDLDEMALDTPLGRMEGRLVLTLGVAGLRITGELSADAITVEGADTGNGGGRLFPRRAVDLSFLSVVDASVRARIGRLSIGGLRMTDVDAPVTVEGGRLETNATATFATGVTNAALAMDAAGNEWSLTLDLKKADAGDALGMLGVTTAEKGGRLDMHTTLTAAGADTQALLSSLAGRISVDASQLHMRAGVTKLAGSDVLSSMARMARGADGERITVECAVARVTVRDGVASSEDGIGAQTRTVNVKGRGRVSLPEERLDLVFRPWPREGLGLSASAVVGAVSVTGHLSDPRVGLTDETVLRGGATAGAALLTGGLSLIAQGLMERARGDAPCQEAAGGPGRAAAARTGTAPATLDKAADSVGSTVKSIGDTLKGIFGSPGQGSGSRPAGSEQ